MINKIAAIVVLFHPPEEVFCNISTYSRIIKDIIIIDNSGKKADKNRKIYNGMMKTYFYQFLGAKPPARHKGRGPEPWKAG